MKKNIFIVVIFLFLLHGFPLFSLELATGGGLRIAPYNEGLNISAEGYQTARLSYRWTEWGMYAFFDAQYVEFDMTYYRAISGYYELANFGDNVDFKTQYDTVNISYLDLALIGKYPLKLGNAGSMLFFGGFMLKINLASNYGYKKNEGDYTKGNWNQMWIKTGIGYDIPIHPKLFLRPSMTLGFPLKTPWWKDREKTFQKAFAEEEDIDIKVRYSGIGFEFSLAVGYRIN